MQPGIRTLGSLFASVLAASAAASVGARAQWEGGDETRPCPTMLQSFTGSGFHQGKTFVGVEWQMFGGPSGNVATYVSAGNGRPGLTIDVTGQWEWINAKARFQCTQIWIGTWFDQWQGLETWGSLVPYTRLGGDSLSQAPTPAPPGGVTSTGGGGAGPHYYVCYYYEYSDGSRSPYQWCEYH